MIDIIIHRGTHQIGGVATEIKTPTTRILIDMGEELCDNKSRAKHLKISGITDTALPCDGVLLTHYHGDHVGEFSYIREDIPIYMGALCKDVLLATIPPNSPLWVRISQAITFTPGVSFQIGDITITPLTVDHSACDNYMFFMETHSKKILHTGDFRTHGFRGKALVPLLKKYVGTVDVLITEGTTLSRTNQTPLSEHDLQQKLREYQKQYKYIFIHCATTNLERICGFAHTVPRGKYFICDNHQKRLLRLIEQHAGHLSPLYRDLKIVVFQKGLIEKLKTHGFVMLVRDNAHFRDIMSSFDKQESLILYSMWDGYRTDPKSTIPNFLNIIGNWQPLHTSGHASLEGLQWLIHSVKPNAIIPIHTDNPEQLSTLFPNQRTIILNDGETFHL